MIAKFHKPLQRTLTSVPSVTLRADSQLQRRPQQSCACGGTCSKCRADQFEQEHEYHSKGGSDHSWNKPVPAIVNDVLNTSGQPLDAETRTCMEPRFGHDFSRVRVYADSAAAESARTLHALAYTVGPNIAFGAGQFAPETQAGRRLLAHELAHVVQQEQGLQRGIQRQDDAKQEKTPTKDEMLREILCGSGGRGLFGRTKLSEIYRFSGTFFTNPPELSAAEIEDLRTGKRDLYYVGDRLNDEWQIVDIGLNQVTVISATCGTEEILGREDGGASQPSKPSPDHSVEVFKGTKGRGKVEIFDNCKRVEFTAEGSSTPSVYIFDEGISEYVLEGDKSSTFTPLRLAQILGVRLLEYEKGKLHAGNCGKPYGVPRTNMK